MKKQKWSIGLLLSIIFIDYVGVGIVFVMAPQIFLTHSSVVSTTHTGLFQLKFLFCLFLGAYPLGQYFGAPFFGKKSDQYGRKKVLLFTLACTFLGYAILTLGLFSRSTILLIFGRLLSGLSAGNVAVAQAGIIDASTADNKAKNMSFIQSAIGLAWIVGTPMGGILYARFSGYLLKYTAPLLLAQCLLVLAFLGIFFFFTDISKSNNVSIPDSEPEIAQINSEKISPRVKSLLLVWFIFIFAQWVFEALMPGYFVEKFSFSGDHIGLILGSMGLVYVLSQLLIVKQLANKVNQLNFIAVSLFLTAFAVFAFYSSHTNGQLALVLFVYVLSMAFVLSYYFTLVSNEVPASQQGQIMGKLSSLQAVAAIIAMFVGGGMNIFNENFPIITSFFAFMLSAALFLFILHRHSIKWSSKKIIEAACEK